MPPIFSSLSLQRAKYQRVILVGEKKKIQREISTLKKNLETSISKMRPFDYISHPRETQYHEILKYVRQSFKNVDL